jgi:cytidyltransferase-like protein
MAEFAAKPKGKVMVSGCYDLLHSGHVAFFKEASAYGDLYVSVGSDANILLLKNHKPMFPEDERLYMVKANRYVHDAFVCRGKGMLDFEADLDVLKPDRFVVNEDGDRPAKKEACGKRGIEYVVLKRVPDGDLQERSSTAIKADLAGPKAGKQTSNFVSIECTLARRV